jgi:hypothetical protein
MKFQGGMAQAGIVVDFVTVNPHVSTAFKRQAFSMLNLKVFHEFGARRQQERIAVNPTR